MPMNDPIEIFRQRFDEVLAAGLPEPTAMVLATADAHGKPSARVVLLKAFDARGFVFYTNLESRKGHDLHENPQAALCFFWQPLGYQVRVEGRVELVTVTEADEYFSSRARGSQIGAWASLQSRHLESRQELLARVAEYEKRFEGAPVPRPEHWSGFRLIPDRIEFWTAGEFRLHDRLIFASDGNGGWTEERIFP
jgi:pyridoxamine 5'-phosphate oxidase